MRRISNHIGRAAVAAILFGGNALAGEYALLVNGFRLHADRHEVEGDSVKLYSGNGMTAIAASQITGFEAEEYTPPPPAAVASSPVPPAASLAPKTDMFEATAKRHGLPVALVRSIVKAESNYRTDAVSPKGAIGLMQLMPGTAKILGADPTDPAQNVDAGTRYLRELLARYEDKDDQVVRAIAAYNAGPGAVDKYHGVPPYRETQDYVRRVLKSYDKLRDVN
jgi:soluble lytic murein transglycosylase-like protein